MALTHLVRVRILGGGLKTRLMIRELVIKEFKALLEDNKRNVAYIVEVAEKAGFTNEQFYIDWEDFLNKVSIRDHNK